MVDTAKEQLDALSSIGKLTRQRNDEGATSLSDVVQTDARIEGARAQLMQYRGQPRQRPRHADEFSRLEHPQRGGQRFPAKAGPQL